MKKPTKKSLLTNIVVAACIFLCGNLFDGMMSFGVFIGGVYCANPAVACLACIASSAIYGLKPLCFASVRVAVIMLALLIHRAAKRKIGKKLLVLYILAANVFYCAYDTVDFTALWDKLFALAVGLAFSYVSVYVLRAVFVRGLKYRPALDETVCISVFATVMCFALVNLRLGPYCIADFIVPFTILFTCVAFGGEAPFVTAAIAGMGYLFSQNSFVPFGLYTLFALSACAMNRLNRFVAAIAVVICDVLLAYFFGVHGNFDFFALLPCAVSALLFVLLPQKAVNYVSDVFGRKSQHAGRNVVNKLSARLSRKLYQLSDVFFAMKSTFVAMAMDSVSKDEAKTAIVKRVRDGVCGDCKERGNCWRNNAEDTEKSMFRLSDGALERGKVTILDVSPSLSYRCDRLNSILSTVNSGAESWTQYNRRSKETDSSRMLIGEQLGGVSKIMRQLATDCRSKITFDGQKENLIKDELIFHNILTSEAAFVQQGGDLSVILTVAKSDLDSESIEKIVSSVVKQKMSIDKIESTAAENWSSVYLSPAPHFRLTYGVRSAVKSGSEMSGDTHSFVQIDSRKFMLAVCDGMGSGENAERASEIAISLVENFYKAGFDNDVILSCVNKLLGSFNTETFTAVDICVVDLQSGLCDFIKLGAVNGLVKTGGQVQYVSGSSLPLGVLEEMSPSITTKALTSGDVVVLMSDGVWDSAGDADGLATVLAETSLTNPQIIADELAEFTLSKCKNKPKDDVTIVVARIAE